MDLLFQVLNLILLVSEKLHYMCTILVQSYSLRICREGGEHSEKNEQKISLKGDGNGRDGNGAKFFASLFQCWHYNPVAILSLCILAHAYHVEFQMAKKKPSLNVTVVFLV